MDDVGVIHGRFQVLHNDHLSYLLAGKERCRRLVVGITNPDPSATTDDPADPHRSLPVNNPLTYYERYVLVREAFREVGIPWEDFLIVPFPINAPPLWRYYVPLGATFYLTVYDDWGKRKLERFNAMGLKTDVLWEKSLAGKGISALEVRRKMAQGLPWQHLVPPSTAVLLEKWLIPARIRSAYDALAGEETTL